MLTKYTQMHRNNEYIISGRYRVNLQIIIINRYREINHIFIFKNTEII